MHASTEQLLAVLNGDCPAAGICGCEECARALHELRARRRALRELPVLPAPDGGWQRVQSALQQAGRPACIRPVWGRAAASLGALAAVLMTISWLQQGSHQPQADGVWQRPAGVHRLVEESRALESLLSAVEQRSPSVMNASTAGLIVSLEDRIALVDYGLSHPDRLNLSPAQSKKLWEQRVTLMTTLVEAHGASIQQVDY